MRFEVELGTQQTILRCIYLQLFLFWSVGVLWSTQNDLFSQIADIARITLVDKDFSRLFIFNLIGNLQIQLSFRHFGCLEFWKLHIFTGHCTGTIQSLEAINTDMKMGKFRIISDIKFDKLEFTFFCFFSLHFRFFAV